MLSGKYSSLLLTFMCLFSMLDYGYAQTDPIYGTAVETNSFNAIDNAVTGVNNDQFVVTYTQLNAGGNGVQQYIRVGTITGDNTITLGVQVAVSPSSRPNRYLRVARIADNTCVVCYNHDDASSSSNDRLRCRVGTVSGTGSSATISLGPENNTGVRPQTSVYPAIARLSDTKIAVAFEHDNGTSDRGAIFIGDISGSGASAAITFGSIQYFTNPGQDVKNIGLDALSGSVLALTYEDDDNADLGKTTIATVSGTSVTYNTAIQFNTGNSVGMTNVVALETDKYAIIWGRDDTSTANDDLFARVAEVSGSGALSTVSFGTEYLIDDDSSPVNQSDFRVTGIGGDSFVVAYHRSGAQIYTLVGKVDGTDITISSRVEAFDKIPDYIDVGLVKDGRFVIAYQDEEAATDPGYVVVGNSSIAAAAPSSATLAASVYLEGAFNGTDLNTTLNADIPTAQPYAGSDYNNHTGSESGSIPANAVDWVLVELREAGSAAAALNSTKVGSAAGFLMSDGSIKATDGTSNLSIPLSGNTGSDFYVVIYHRNHLPIMSANAISQSSGVYTIDFTSIAANTYQGTTALSILTSGKFAMPAGDADGDGDVDAADLTTWRTQNGAAFSYNTTNGDFNLDGAINAVDRNDFQKKNISKTRQVPST